MTGGEVVPVDVDELIDSIEADGARLADAAAQAGLDTTVPTCPEWTIRDLLLHLGEVHRWAATIVGQGIAKPSAVPPDHVGPLPSDHELVTWFRDGVRRVVLTLRTAPADVTCFTFLADAGSPLRFWARRQAHETAIHRVDAERAVGRLTPMSAELAADGVDELLTGFAPRKQTPLHSTEPVTMQVVLDDVPACWRMTIDDGPPRTERIVADSDCAVSGTATDVLLALWNRQSTDALHVSGRADVLDLFLENLQVRWR